jgi:PAS domain S-box-containing protein
MDNATDEAIITTDPMGIILIWNEGARRLLGYESEEMVGRESIRIFRTEEYLKSGIMDVNIKKMIATGKPLTKELDYVAKDGKMVPVQEIVSPRFDEDGKFIGMVSMARDITERKKAEAELQKLNEELEQRVKDRTAELKKKNKNLEIMNEGFIGRELRMVELKKRIAELEKNAGPDKKPGDKTI